MAESFANAFSLETSTSHSRKEIEDKSEAKAIKELREVKSVSNIGLVLNSSFQDMSTRLKPDKEYDDYKNEVLPLLCLPDIALENILSFLAHDQIAQMRVICKR